MITTAQSSLMDRSETITFLFRLDFPPFLEAQFTFEIACNPCFSNDIFVSWEVGISDRYNQPPWSDTAKDGKEDDEPEVECWVNDFDFAVVRES